MMPSNFIFFTIKKGCYRKYAIRWSTLYVVQMVDPTGMVFSTISSENSVLVAPGVDGWNISFSGKGRSFGDAS
jgi:hypothetical protein